MGFSAPLPPPEAASNRQCDKDADRLQAGE